MWKKLLLVGCFVVVANAGSVSFIKKCAADDYKCQKEAAQLAIPYFADGIPEIGIEKLDPLHYSKLDASSKDLKLVLNDLYIGGIKDCQVKKMIRDVSNSKLAMKAICTLTIDGQYDIHGRLLFIPIEGKGKVTGVLRKVLLNVEGVTAEKTGKDGKVHWEIKSWKHSYELKDRAELDLENLFEGNELLGEAARQLLKSSANEVIDEVGPPIIKALLTKAIKVVAHFFKEVPVEDLIL